MRRLVFLLTLLAAALSFAAQAKAQSRVALVIGNGAYASMPTLRNPANDAADMAATLQGLGFALVGGGPQVNVGRLQFLNLLRDFAAAVRPGDVALFYYAGHGLQVEGVNYMAPVDDRDIRYQEDVPDLAVSLNTLQRHFKDKGAAPLIVILDACRDNPLPSRTRNASRGLARLELGSGAYIAFATSPGSTANDGAGRNGRFTAALLQALGDPARRIEDVFIDVTNRVEAESGGGQSPWTSSNLRAPFHFAAASRPPPPPVAAAPIQPAVGVFPERRNPGEVFKDCADCPEMVVVPAGSFVMGSAAGEGDDDEHPQRRVTISRHFAVGRYEVTRGEFAQFVSQTQLRLEDGCNIWMGKWIFDGGKNWRAPGYSQTDRHPVVCVSWEDAQKYVQWISQKTGKNYRLLTESEWEYSAKANTVATNSKNSKEAIYPGNFANSNRGTVYVGSYEQNDFKLYDMFGNVWEWVEDCYMENYNNASADASAVRLASGCKRVVRGGSWNSNIGNIRAENRFGGIYVDRDFNRGFRIARNIQ